MVGQFVAVSITRISDVGWILNVLVQPQWLMIKLPVNGNRSGWSSTATLSLAHQRPGPWGVRLPVGTKKKEYFSWLGTEFLARLTFDSLELLATSLWPYHDGPCICWWKWSCWSCTTVIGISHFRAEFRVTGTFPSKAVGNPSVQSWFLTG